MRPFTSFVAGLVALVAALVTVPLMWVSANVADEDGYVAFSSRLATDQELQSAFSAYLADDFVNRGLLPGSLRKAATSAMTVVARSTTNRPGFVSAWEDTQRSFHTSAFDGGTGPLTVQVAPMAKFLTGRLGDLLPISLAVPEDLVVPVGTEQERSQVARLDQSRTFGLLGLLVVVIAAAVSFFAARSRPLAIAGLGLGAIVVAGVLRVASSVITPKVLDRTEGQTGFARTLQKLLADRASDSLAQWLTSIAVCGAVAAVVGLAGRVITGRHQQ
ncbi:MAG: hypothetical protein JWR27_823 [Aeromicrobium sp.]|nr:hypothetical protein [Aeromicrobium sp.]